MTNKHAQILGKLGGKASAKSRFAGKTKKEVSALMRAVRLTKKQEKEFKEMVQGSVDNLNTTVLLEQKR